MNNQRKVSFELKSLSNYIKRYTGKKLSEDFSHQLTPMQVGIIMYLYKEREREVFQRDIEEAFSIRRSTASSMLQTMEKKQLIVRKPVKQDARLKEIQLTKKAIGLREEASAAFIQLEAQLKNNIPQEDLDIFFAVIEKMKKNIK